MGATTLNKASDSNQTRQPKKEKEKIKNKEVKEDHPMLGKAEEAEGTRMGNMHTKNI